MLHVASSSLLKLSLQRVVSPFVRKDKYVFAIRILRTNPRLNNHRHDLRPCAQCALRCMNLGTKSPLAQKTSSLKSNNERGQKGRTKRGGGGERKVFHFHFDIKFGKFSRTKQAASLSSVGGKFPPNLISLCGRMNTFFF